MRWSWLRLALPAALLVSPTSCYFLSNFDDLGSASATSSSGSGGGRAATTESSSSAGSSTSSVAGSGGAGGAGATTTTATAAGTGGMTCPPPGASYAGLVMNELAPKGLPADWIELRNNGPVAVPLCGVMVTQNYDDITVPSGPDRFTFGAVYLAPGKYLVIAAVSELPFGLSKDAPERISLFAPDGKLLDDTSWMASPATEFTSLESWARIPDGTGPFKRVENPTKGTSNFELGGMDAGAGDAGDGG